MNGSYDEESAARGRTIVKTSIIGIIANVLLAGFKAVIGLIAGSIAVVLDAVNNLSDALSSIITIVGTKLAAKAPNKKHPYGYGRIEYLTAVIISLIILYAGITSMAESVKAILEPGVPEYSTLSLVIISVAVAVKIVLGIYVKATGKKVRSDSLIASGQDALMDSIISASTLVAAIIFMITGLSLEAYLGVIISAIIIKAGVEQLISTLSSILGERADAQTVTAIKNTVNSIPEVLGTYDIVLHNYGPDTLNGSLHVEVDDSLTAIEIDELTRKIQMMVYCENHILINAVSVYSTRNDEQSTALRKKLSEMLKGYDNILQTHGFYVNNESKTISYDIVIGWDAKDRIGEYHSIEEASKKLFEGYNVIVNLDSDWSI